MSKRNRWLLLLTVSIALALIGIDMTVLYTALPSLTHELATTASEKLWIVMAYGLVVAGPVPGFGALADRPGHRRTFVGGVLLEYFWWGSVFLIDVPLVAASLLSALLLIPDSANRSDRDWDLVGSLQVVAGLVGFAYVVEELGSPRSPYVVVAAAAVGAAVILTVFIRRQLRLTSPLIDFARFRSIERLAEGEKRETNLLHRGYLALSPKRE